MAKFFVDAFADMFGVELKNNNLELAPSKIKYGNKILNFTGWDKVPTNQINQDVLKEKYSIMHISQEEWEEFFTPFLESGEDIAFFTISHKLFTDGGCDLRSAFAHLQSKFPERQVKLIDTLTVSRGVSEIASLASLVFKKEQNFESAIKFATNLVGQFVSVFVCDDIKFMNSSVILKNAGSKLTGGLINVKPIISIDKSGNFNLLDKARGFKAGVNKLFSTVKVNGENIADFTFTILHSNAEVEALELKQKFLEIIDETDIRIMPSSLNNMIYAGTKFVCITFHSK